MRKVGKVLDVTRPTTKIELRSFVFGILGYYRKYISRFSYIANPHMHICIYMYVCNNVRVHVCMYCIYA